MEGRLDLVLGRAGHIRGAIRKVRCNGGRSDGAGVER
jgi:hypothetical protein